MSVCQIIPRLQLMIYIPRRCFISFFREVYINCSFQSSSRSGTNNSVRILAPPKFTLRQDTSGKVTVNRSLYFVVFVLSSSWIRLKESNNNKKSISDRCCIQEFMWPFHFTVYISLTSSTLIKWTKKRKQKINLHV